MGIDDDRQLPHSLNAERAFLGALLLDGRAVAKACLVVEPGMFYSVMHQHIYIAVLDVAPAVDLLLVTDRLRQMNRLEEAGGVTMWRVCRIPRPRRSTGGTTPRSCAGRTGFGAW
jgi:replicative DNA helicase